ncbi:MAG: BACON domain-containing protein [Bacteroidales bacterium]|nr:BACON domain-containing protein [Bacteroidales bacterium]
MKRTITLITAMALVLVSCVHKVNPKQEQEQNQEQEQKPDQGGDKTLTLTLSADKMVFSSYGGIQSFSVTTNSETFSATAAEGNTDWITVSQDGSAFTVIVSENTGTAERTGKIIVSYGDKTQEVTIRQEAAGETSDLEDVEVSYTLSEDAVVAPKGLVSYITFWEPGMFIVDKNVPAELLPTVPSKLIINTPTEVLPDGLLAKIYDMQEDAGGYKFYYATMQVNEAFKDLNINMEGIDLDSYVTRIVDASGQEMEFLRTKAAGMTKFHIVLPEVSWDLPLGLTLTPKMTIDLALKLQMIVGDWKISTFNFKVDADVKVGAEIEFAIGESLDKAFKLLSLYFAAIPVGPVLLTPSVDIYANVGVDGKISLVASVSSVMHSSSHLHYDEINGLSGESTTSDFTPEETEYSCGPKIEGGFSYGIGIGPALGIYGDAISAGIILNVARREAVSTSIDLTKIPEGQNWFYPNYYVAEGIRAAEYSTSYVVQASLNFRAVGYSDKYDLPAVTFPQESYKFFPPFDKDNVQIEQRGSEMAVKLNVNAPSVFSGCSESGSLIVLLYNDSMPLQSTLQFPFAISEDDATKLMAGEISSYETEALVSGLDVGRYYEAYVAWKYNDQVFPLYPVYGLRSYGNIESDVRAILDNVRSQGRGNWEGCNWDDDVPLSLMKNIDIDYWPSLGNYQLVIDLPNEWELGNNLRFNHKMSGSEDFRWRIELEPDGSVRHFSSIEVTDETFDGIAIRNKTWRGPNQSGGFVVAEIFECHSKSMYSFPLVTNKLDISGTSITHLGLGRWGPRGYDATYTEASEIIADNCPDLETISIEAPDDSRITSLSAKNCPKLERVSLNGAIDVTSALIANIAQSSGYGVALSIECPDTKSLTVGSGIRSFQTHTCEALTVTGATHLEDLYVSNSNLKTLSVTECPKLRNLYAGKTQLSSFSISGTPSMANLSIENNPSLKCTVPAVFDQMRASGFTPRYDQMYEYSWSTSYYEGAQITWYFGSGWHYATSRQNSEGDTWYSYWHKRLDYGFYYSREPGCGYHLSSELPR